MVVIVVVGAITIQLDSISGSQLNLMGNRIDGQSEGVTIHSSITGAFLLDYHHHYYTVVNQTLSRNYSVTISLSLLPCDLRWTL